MKQKEQIRTPRLLLRPFTLRDTDAVFDYSVQDDVGPDAGWRPHETHGQTRVILRELIAKGGSFAIVELARDQVVGSISLTPDNKRQNTAARALGYVLGRACWGRGFATEAARALIRHAFDVQKVHIVSAYHYPHNTRSKRVLEKCGMRYDGLLRCATWRFDGRLLDELCYSITEQEYRRIEKSWI